MTHLAIHSPSAAVARSLQAIAEASGHQLQPDAEYRLQHSPERIALYRSTNLVAQLELPARPAAIARLLSQLETSPALLGGWQFDATARQLTRENEAHALTEKEALLLGHLLASYPEACSRDALLKDIWSMQADVETHTLETHIYRLRHKLAGLTPKPCDIVTVDSAYLLTLEPTA